VTNVDTGTLTTPISASPLLPRSEAVSESLKSCSHDEPVAYRHIMIAVHSPPL